MACEHIDLGGGASVIICRGRGRSSPCRDPGCTDAAVALCDWPLEGAKKGATCSRGMCARHRHSVGKNKDYCEVHHKLHLERQPELFTKGG